MRFSRPPTSLGVKAERSGLISFDQGHVRASDRCAWTVSERILGQPIKRAFDYFKPTRFHQLGPVTSEQLRNVTCLSGLREMMHGEVPAVGRGEMACTL